MRESDAKWLWADYQMGNVAWLSQDLTVQEFRIAIRIAFQHTNVYHVGPERPVGMFWVTPTALGRVLSAHWFPWATPRQKLEHMVKFLHDVRKKATLVWATDERDFYVRTCQYGVARRIGTFQDFFGVGKPAGVFQTRLTRRD